MTQPTIAVAGATGNLGARIVHALLERGAAVRVLARPGSAADKVQALRARGAHITETDMRRASSVADACKCADCVVSAVLGLRDVMVEAQSVLLDGAVAAGVPRFIPSDYCLDFTRMHDGENRNIDLHREFTRYLDRAQIAATSIFNGAFMELLEGKAPLILYKRRLVLYWSNPDQLLDFTTIDDTASYTAAAAIDPSTPRVLKIAGEQITARGLADVMTSVSGTPFRLQWAGSLGMLGAMIQIARAVNPAPGEAFPPWQGMQYFRNMFDGRSALSALDNDRYPGMRWTKVRDVVSRVATRA